MSDPWFKFYPSDWRSDPGLKMCSMEARGLWIEMICLMHEGTPYGHLLVNGQPLTDAQLAALVGTTPDQITALLGELAAAGVFSRTRADVIYSRKMTRMAKKSANARKNGRKGGNPKLEKQRENPPLDNQEHNQRHKPQNPETRYQIKEEEDAHARDPDSDFQKKEDRPALSPGLLDDLRQAVGIQPHEAGPYWSDQPLAAHVASWIAEGLTEAQVVAEAKASRAKNPDPPDGPKALNRWMQAAAKALRNVPAPGQAKPGRAEAKPPPTPEERLKFWADWVNGDKPLPPSAINNTLAYSLLDARLVTRERMRERGVAV